MKIGALFGYGILLLLLMAWGLSFLLDYPMLDEARCSLFDPARTPSSQYWLGTDHCQRDVWKRLIMSSQAFVGPGLGAALLAASGGIIFGAAAGYGALAISRTIGALFSVVTAVPPLIIALLCAAIWGSTPGVLAWATGVACVPTIGQEISQRIRALRQQNFVAATRAHGVPHWKILSYHLLWANCRNLVMRQFLRVFGFYVVLEATLSYLDRGHFSPRYPTWGSMIRFEIEASSGNHWAWTAPALAVWLTVLGLNLVADHYREGQHD